MKRNFEQEVEHTQILRRISYLNFSLSVDFEKFKKKSD